MCPQSGDADRRVIRARVRGARPLAGHRAPVAGMPGDRDRGGGRGHALPRHRRRLRLRHPLRRIDPQPGRQVRQLQGAPERGWSGSPGWAAPGSGGPARPAPPGPAAPGPAAGAPAGAAAPIGQASVCTVTWQPAGTQPNVLFTVPWHPPAAPPPAAVPAAGWLPAWVPALAGVPADGPDPAVTVALRRVRLPARHVAVGARRSPGRRRPAPACCPAASSSTAASPAASTKARARLSTIRPSLRPGR